MYKIYISDRKYRNYNIVVANDLKNANITVDPIKNKMFTQDIFDVGEDGNIIIQHSTVKSMQKIPAVLVLEGNKMYGRYKDKFLYKCIPDDKRLPVFLVPYKIKTGFSKKLTNKYVTFEYKLWKEKHPQGVIVQTIGDVSDLPNFYEYQLYCKSLYASIQNFTKDAMRKLKQKSEDAFIQQILNTYKLEDRRMGFEIYSIDPTTSKDFDDAFSYKKISETNSILSIYISNVAIWLDALELWSSFSNRISTIYLPDRKRPMLPTILSDALCSLQEKRTRFAFTMDILIDTENLEIIDFSLKNTAITVKKNLRYDTEEQETNETYNSMKSIIYRMNRKKKYRYMESISTSHEVIAYIMILMNYLSAKDMKENKIGIYRSAKYNDEQKINIPENIPLKTQKFLKMWQSSGGSYVKFENIEGHEILDLDAYVHITSPIRRLVDLLNILQYQDKLNLMPFNEKSIKFYERWTNEESFDYINKTMRSIRKVQNDCSLLRLCVVEESVTNTIHDGFVFDKILRNDGLFQYMVYLDSINMVNRIASRFDIENNTMQKCKLFLFTDEINLKQKVRIEIC